jgi:hypothetical protein
MADIRIKDLTTTASSTASDDFIAVDGATNGTRKLNAYNPSFGGTLTVNGTGLSAFAGNVETVGAAASDRFFQTVASGTLATAIGQNTSGSTNAFGIASGNSYVGNAQNYGLAFSTNAVTRMTISNGSTGGNVSISSTTASTSTSTGALVVSGGVGVAGKIYAGSNISSAATLESTAGAVESVATDSYFNLRAGATLQGYIRGYSPSAEIYFYNARSGPLILGTNSTTALTLTSAQKAEFAATIKTAAPSGGTAAEWKLGTVASVSPTSPNRTIEVDIGGTIYYIHAKTTNN